MSYIKILCNFLDPPENVVLKLTRSDNFVTLTCSAEAQPSASFKIFLNETELVSTNKTYTIPEVNVSHVGNYTCVAKNILGTNTSNSEYLSLQGKIAFFCMKNHVKILMKILSFKLP